MKVIGIILTSLCILGIGNLRCDQWKKRYEQSEALCALVGYIKNRISQFRMPLAEIYSTWQERVDHGEFDTLLRERGLCEALSQVGNKLDVSESLLNLLFDLSGKLGKSDGEEQVALCKQYQEQMMAICEAERAALHDRLKVNRTVSVAAAVMAAILFF